jgi:hypothetical protein
MEVPVCFEQLRTQGRQAPTASYPPFAGVDEAELLSPGEAAPALSPPPHPDRIVASTIAIAVACNAALTSAAKSFMANPNETRRQPNLLFY